MPVMGADCRCSSPDAGGAADPGTVDARVARERSAARLTVIFEHSTADADAPAHLVRSLTSTRAQN